MMPELGAHSLFRSHPIPLLILFALLLIALHGVTIYQLVSGRAGCWPWQTRSEITKWWLYRVEQPAAYWFRIGMFSFFCIFLDAAFVVDLITVMRPS